MARGVPGTAANWADLLLSFCCHTRQSHHQEEVYWHPNDVTDIQVGNRMSVSVCVLNLKQT